MAIPDEELEKYRIDQGLAQPILMPDNDIVGVLAKLRKHIYVFRNRRGWKDALQNQCQATNIAFKQLVLDMPVR
jgi:hypothetical protein